ncbi:E3 ubiquitin-protein ligase RNF103 [Fasciola hepatica]|uniref:E3 ubiquitin-protein ligase RNF103 n=1 Tax=Fasciola hepatica TaxID=6192 RepID=A0A4E0QV21_FASHE|nr:E3 ubiquitin-protein ligase RNF103 [Fasciola hepatica]
MYTRNYSSFHFPPPNSLCQERGLTAADLILALPKGGDRIKDSVQYRAFPKQSISHSPAAVTDIALQQIHSWIAGVLAERVRSVEVVDDIVPGSVDWPKSVIQKISLKRRWISWLTEKPKPIHVIWMYNKTSSSTDHIMDTALSARFPPFVLSALSVPFTGRVRFWVAESVVGPNSHRGTKMKHWPAPKASTSSVQQLLDFLDCPLNSTYFVLTPEAKCLSFGKRRGEYLSYSNLELYLRLLYPSVDDVLLAFFFLLNLLVLLNTAVRGGKLMAFVGRRWMGMPISYTHEQFGLIQSFVRLARQGWTLHRPSRIRHNLSQSLSSTVPNRSESRAEPGANERNFSVKKQVIHWGKSSIVEFFSYNLFFLLTVLPVINALSLSHTACILNLSLWVLRTFVLIPPVVSLRISIVEGHFCWFRLASVIAFYYVTVLISAAHVYFVLLGAKPHTRLRQRTVSFLSSRRLTHAPPNELLAELTRSLLISDLEPRMEQTTSSLSGNSSSSPSEIESVAPDSVATSSRPSNRSLVAHTVEQVRLLRRLGRLHELLHEGSHYLPANSVHPPEDVAFEIPERGDIRANQRAAPAHIYTWQCSLLSQSDAQSREASIMHSDSRSGKPRQLRRPSCGNINIHPAHPSCTSSLEAEGEEDDLVAEHNNTALRQAQGRQMHHYRRGITVSQRSEVDSSSNDESIQNCFDRSSDPSTEAKSFVSPAVDWPPWVIPCAECVVCWRVFRPGVRLGALPCGHGFHEACIRRWLDTGALDCPVCRWPAHAPHLRQQRQMIGQLLSAVQSTLSVGGTHILTNNSR